MGKTRLNEKHTSHKLSFREVKQIPNILFVVDKARGPAVNISVFLREGEVLCAIWHNAFHQDTDPVDGQVGN